MAMRPYHPPAPFAVPAGGTVEDRLAAVAVELNRKAYAGVGNTAVQFIGLLSPDGTTWKLSVDNTGAVHTEVVPR